MPDGPAAFTMFAAAAFARLPPRLRRLIMDRTQELDGIAAGTPPALRLDRPVWCVRADGWRLLFDQRDGAAVVLAIAPGHAPPQMERLRLPEHPQDTPPQDDPPVIHIAQAGAYAVVPLEEYRRLTTAAARLEEADAALVTFADRYALELLPDALLAELANGANPLRTCRLHRRLRQADVAAAIGVSEVYVSQLETGVRDGSTDIWRRLALLLRVPVELLWMRPDAGADDAA